MANNRPTFFGWVKWTLWGHRKYREQQKELARQRNTEHDLQIQKAVSDTGVFQVNLDDLERIKRLIAQRDAIRNKKN